MYGQVIEAVGSMDESVGGESDMMISLKDTLPRTKYMCPRIEEESEGEMTEKGSRDSLGSAGRNQLVRISCLPDANEEDVYSQPSPIGREKRDTVKLPKKMTGRESTGLSKFGGDRTGQQKDSHQSEETQDATQDLPPTITPQEMPLRRAATYRPTSDTRATRSGMVVPSTVTTPTNNTHGKSQVAQSINKKLREFGVKRPLKLSMVSAHSEEQDTSDGGLKRSLTRSENKDMFQDGGVTQSGVEDRNPLRWLFVKPKKANPVATKERILATLGLPVSARQQKAVKSKMKGSGGSFEISRGRWRHYSESCVFSAGDVNQAADQA